MEVTIVTTPDKLHSEVPVVIELFKAGLTTLHLRKTKFSTVKLAEYLEAIPKKYHNRIIIHSHHKLALKFSLKGVHLSKKHRKKSMNLFLKVVWLRIRKPKISITRSFHQVESLQDNKFKYHYVFLNPFFTKIDPMKNSFDVNPEYLKKVIARCKCPVYASGNITMDNILSLKKYGVSGVVLSKLFWQQPGNKLEFFNAISMQLKDE
jgi:thiamine-phosphate pyrophosphorylase